MSLYLNILIFTPFLIFYKRKKNKTLKRVHKNNSIKGFSIIGNAIRS